MTDRTVGVGAAEDSSVPGPGISAQQSDPQTTGPRPTPSRPTHQSGLDRRDGASALPSRSGVVQPKPQTLPKRSGPASIIVSPRQKGNPILNNVKAMPWEYGDIPADYVLGLTTCALFLSLKYHRIHPEYIYTRIRNLQGKYLLRILLVMVDIPNHEESLKELSKTSLINNVTIILCWSAAEGGKYLELFKQCENAAPTAIKQHQSEKYFDRMVDFITTPRSINKTDAVSLVSQFGSVRTAVNAREEEVAMIAGWGAKKVERWCKSVREPFRVKRAAKRGHDEGGPSIPSVPISRMATLSRDVTRDDTASPEPHLDRPGSGTQEQGPSVLSGNRRPTSGLAQQVTMDDEIQDFADDEEAMAEVMAAHSAGAASISPRRPEEASKKRKPTEDPLSEGIAAALSKLRKQG